MKKLNWPKYRFLFLLVLLIGGGVFCTIYGARLWGHPAEAIGDALIIAGALGLTVDGYVKAHLLHEASRDISMYLLGYHLPAEIQSALKALMLTGRVSRDLHLHYKLTVPPEAPDKVSVELTLSYGVENLTYDRSSYSQYFYQRAIYSPRFIELRCDSSDPLSTYSLKEEELREQVKNQQGAFDLRVVGSTIRLQPRSREDKATYQFTTKCISLYPQEESDVFVFDYPCVGVSIKAEYPEDFEFQGPTEPHEVNRWFYPRVFLGGEQITMHWRKKRKVEEA